MRMSHRGPGERAGGHEKNSKFRISVFNFIATQSQRHIYDISYPDNDMDNLASVASRVLLRKRQSVLSRPLPIITKMKSRIRSRSIFFQSSHDHNSKQRDIYWTGLGGGGMK
jgi:hypothetical protein